MHLKYKTDPLQNIQEHGMFLDLLCSENVTSYLEIGSKFGGSLWRVANALPEGSKIVAVDRPERDSQIHLQACIAELVDAGYKATLLLGDSTDKAIIDHVTRLGPFDCVFIDANHTLPFVTSDWNNYGKLARIVAFHDIGWVARPTKQGKMPIDVPKFWDSIKDDYQHAEIKLEKRDNGIGVLWRC